MFARTKFLSLIRHQTWPRLVGLGALVITLQKRTMRLVQFTDGHSRVGVELGDGGDVVDLSAANASIPTDMRKFLDGGQSMLQKAKEWVYQVNQRTFDFDILRLVIEILCQNQCGPICLGVRPISFPHCHGQL